MALIKLEFFKEGNQKTADVIIGLKRPESEQFKKWTPAQKKKLKEEFISKSSILFNNFINELR